MQFLECWSELSLLDLVRLLAPAAMLATIAFLPGLRVARAGAIGVALTILPLRELGASPAMTAAWSVLWLLVGWTCHAPRGAARRPLAPTRGGLEAGAVGLLLGLVLLALLIATVARQALSTEEARRASFGGLLLVLGILHLMLHGHARRAGVAFAALGLGLQVLDGVAREAQVSATLPAQGTVLLTTALAVALAMRVAVSRERLAGSAWVSDAHDLHD